MSPRPDSNGYPHICGHAGHVCDTADIADVDLLPEFKMAATTSGFHGCHLEFGSRPTSDNVDSVIPEWARPIIMGVEVGIAAPSLSVQKLFPLPV